MRKSVFFASVLVAGFALADSTEVVSEYVVGVRPVALSAEQTEIVLNIPWVESGTTSGGVAVTNLVKTANLDAGDMLLWYDGSGYQGWTAVAHGGVLYWEPANIATADGVIKATQATQTDLERGQALVLHRAGTDATSVYLVGQDAGSITGTKSAIAGTSDPTAPKYSLVASPAVSGDVNLKTYLTTLVVNGDSVTFVKGGEMHTYYYSESNNAWGYDTMDKGKPKFNAATDEQMTLPAGTGFYYKRVGSETTITW